MRIGILLIMGIVGLYVARSHYCNSYVQTNSSAAVQQLVINRILDRAESCMCGEIIVHYQFPKDGYTLKHTAFFNASKKTLRIEVDPGSGWAFGWEGVDEHVIQQVLQNGGQFSLFTNYRPVGKHVPGRMQEQF